MATRGIFQLTKLQLCYCEIGGSSRAMRDYIGNGQLVLWAQQHPHVTIEVKRTNGNHPIVHADYLTNSDKVLHQVSVKNYESWEHVQEIVQMLSDRSGRKITKITKPVLTDTPSIQGVWTPFLNLQHEPRFKVQIIEPSHEATPTTNATDTNHDTKKLSMNETITTTISEPNKLQQSSI